MHPENFAVHDSVNKIVLLDAALSENLGEVHPYEEL